MNRLTIIALALAACSTSSAAAPGCPHRSWPHWVTDGDLCVLAGMPASLPDFVIHDSSYRVADGRCCSTTFTHLMVCDEPDCNCVRVECPNETIVWRQDPPRVRYFEAQLVEVDRPTRVAVDTLTIGSHDTIVLDGPRIYSKITAPNTYRDPDGKCYSGNVLHVSGERIAVECPR